MRPLHYPSEGFGMLVALGLLIAACGCAGEAALPRAAGSAAGADPPGSGTLTVAPDFLLQSVDGTSVRLSDSAGRVRLIDFWATWCAPCREEIPMLNELQATYGDRGFQILAIAEEDAEVVRSFLEANGVRYLNLLGSAEVAEAYGVLGLPAAYLLDGEGRVVESYFGPKPRRVLVQRIEALLAASAPAA